MTPVQSITAARPLNWLFAALLLATGLVFAPVAARAENGLRDFCAERPGRATPSCILDEGHVMLEIDALDVTRDREDGVTTTATVVASPHLRLGLAPDLEAGVTITPFAEVRTRDPSALARAHGTGDTVFELKLSLKNPDGSGLSVAVMPFVSAPTAQQGLGAGGFQGGVIVPVALSLPGGFSLGLDPEVDALRNRRGDVRPAYVMAAALAHAVAPGVTGGVELWTSQTRRPDGWERLATADATLAWIPGQRPNLQLDAGANVGLTRQTPDVQAYVGISRRF